MKIGKSMSKKKISTYQDDLFLQPKTELNVVWEAITALRESHNSVRRKLFQQIEELRTSLIEAKAQNAQLASIINNQNQYDIFSEMMKAE